MDHQDEGWPLGLRPLNARLGLMRNLDFSVSGSVSFNTLLTASPTSSTLSSSDLDTESTGSFFHEKSKTLGSLIGVSSILELSRRSTRGRRAENLRSDKKSFKSKPWLFSLCSKLNTSAVTVTKTNTTPSSLSLGHFLETERTRAAAINLQRKNQSPLEYGPNDYSPVQSGSQPNSLFVGSVVAPNPSTQTGAVTSNTELIGDGIGNGFGVPLLFPCLRGRVIK